MSEIAMDGMEFEALLQGALLERRAAAEAPTGMVQRLKARLAQEAVASEVKMPFAFAESVRTQRSRASVWTAVFAHAAVLAVVFVLARATELQQGMIRTHRMHVESVLVPPPPVLPSVASIGGGGGAHDVAPVTKGRLPELAQQQIVPPKAPPTIAPKLQVEPTVVVQPDLKMATNSMPNLGMPNAPAAAIGSLGTGSGGGIGAGNGNGVGPGSGGNTGGGVYRIGGGVSAPQVLYQAEAEYSEEARKAKFSGNVLVDVIVDEHGLPTHVRVARGVGMGLDERAVEAVRQYRFRPAMKDGKPVKVELGIEVNYEIF